MLCGYQGWFACEGDGAGRGWHHWAETLARRRPRRKRPCRSLARPLRTGPRRTFRHEDHRCRRPAGRGLQLVQKATVLRHFQWMRDAGIDGVLVQRFTGALRDPLILRQSNTVLAHCREGANRYGRTYAVEYDLSGLGAGCVDTVIDDWRALRQRMKLGRIRPICATAARRWSRSGASGSTTAEILAGGLPQVAEIPPRRRLLRDRRRADRLANARPRHHARQGLVGRAAAGQSRQSLDHRPLHHAASGRRTRRPLLEARPGVVPRATVWNTCRWSFRASVGTTSTTVL